MKLASANNIGGPDTPQSREQAQVRVVVLAFVSFLLGVAATAFWFHVVPNRSVGNASSQTSSSQASGSPAAGQPAGQISHANQPARPYAPNQPPVNATAIAEVKQAIPNLASVSLADGEQILRQAALKQFAAAAKAMNVQVKQAQQQLVQAENGQSAAVQTDARKHLQQTQAEAAENLQQIAAQLQAQIAALKQLKGTAQ